MCGVYEFKKFGKGRIEDYFFGGNRLNWFKGRWEEFYREEEILKMFRKSRMFDRVRD